MKHPFHTLAATRMALPIIRHLGFPVANMHFNLQLFRWENLFCVEFLEDILSQEFASHHILLGRIILHHSRITPYSYISHCFTST